MIRGERGGNALTPPFLAGSPADRRIFGRAGWVLRPLKIFGRPRETTPGRKTADVARQGATSGLRWSGSQPKSAGDSSSEGSPPPRIGGDRPPVTLAPGEAHPFPRRNEDASKLKDLRGWIRLVITRTQDNKLAGKAMKTISVSVDDETHRLARIRAAHTGTTVSAMMRGLLTALLQRPVEAEPAETEPQRRARLLDEVLGRFRREGIGVDTSQILTREEMYDRNAAR